MTTATLESSEANSSTNWESQISELLTTLSSVQGDLLTLLDGKRKALAAGAYGQLEEFTRREAELVARLEGCRQQRERLLKAAGEQGLPSQNVRSLAAALPASQREVIAPSVEQARRQSRLLQHTSLTNWVVVQRTLIHLSQMIEIIATGGRMNATYGQGADAHQGGSLVDQKA